MIPTPETGPLDLSVYPPAEDTYLLLDVLEEYLLSSSPLISLEIGPGSGVISTLIATASPACHCIAVDINPAAATATRKTAQKNGQTVDVICSDLANSILGGKVDLLVFNPPYVVTDPREVSKIGIAASYAGGNLGRQVIDEFLPRVPDLLTPRGVFYLLGIKQNKPEEIISYCREKLGLTGEIVAERKAGIERLWVAKFSKDGKHTSTTQ